MQRALLRTYSRSMKKHIAMVLLQLAASGFDAYYTHRNVIVSRGVELDPVAAPFVHSTPALVTYFSADAAVKIYVTHELRRHGHKAMADLMSTAGFVDSAESAAFSATH